MVAERRRGGNASGVSVGIVSARGNAVQEDRIPELRGRGNERVSMVHRTTISVASKCWNDRMCRCWLYAQG